MSFDGNRAFSDSDVANRIGLGGDRAAEAELYRRMAPRIRLYGLRHLRDRDAADDLVQQVFITVLEALRAGRVREADRLTSFVLGTCRLTVLDIRRNARRKESLPDRFGVDMLSPVPSIGPDLDPEQLASCVQRLKERERAVIVMSFYDEHTGADIARFLGVSDANVRVIRHRSIHQLRGCIGGAA